VVGWGLAVDAFQAIRVRQVIEAPPQMLWRRMLRAMRKTFLILFAVTGLSPQEALQAAANRPAAAASPMARHRSSERDQPLLQLSAATDSIAAQSTFLTPCNFPYPCESSDTCKKAAKPYRATF
jgi:hypothetical protein